MVRSGAFKVRVRMRPALSSRIESFEGFGGDDACMDLAVGCHIRLQSNSYLTASSSATIDRRAECKLTGWCFMASYFSIKPL